MFPIRDHNPSGRTPFVTYALIAINMLVFLGYWGQFSAPGLDQFFYTWGLVPDANPVGPGWPDADHPYVLAWRLDAFAGQYAVFVDFWR